MTQYDSEVAKVKIMREAEEWAKQTKTIHSHSMSSMYYDTHPEDTADNKSVTDVEYNDGTIVRSQGGKFLRQFGERLEGDALYDSFCKNGI
jgi:hypothetical protein